DIVGVAIVTIGVFGLAVLESNADKASLEAQNKIIDKKYQIGFLAITFPILYALIDGLGSFADGIYLDELELIGEDAALLAYEFTFLICAILAYLFLILVKKENFTIFKELDKG